MKDHRNYEGLALALWKHVTRELPLARVAEMSSISAARARMWEKGETPIRAPAWAYLAMRRKFQLEAAIAVLYAPLAPPVFPRQLSIKKVQSQILASLLKKLRQEMTLVEAQEKLRLKSWSSYHHWEQGLREIPLAKFLQSIDQLSSRLALFCEALGFQENLENYGLRGERASFSELFFSKPWIPTVFLAIQTQQYEKQGIHGRDFLARKLRLQLQQVDEALTTLCELRLASFDGHRYRHRKGQFYAPANLRSDTLKALNEYWFGQAIELSNRKGLHKIEQHVLSRASAEKIQGWIFELREKIRQEAKSSASTETLVHIQWQVAELL